MLDAFKNMTGGTGKQAQKPKSSNCSLRRPKRSAAL